MSSEIERKEDAGKGSKGRVKYWTLELEQADKVEDNWTKRARKIIKRYRDEETRDSRRFNILWSNVETLKPTIYAKTPTPEVKRRFLDADPVAKTAAEILERSLSHSLDDYDFDGVIEAVRDEMLLVGRGVARVVYEPNMVKRDVDVHYTSEIDEYGMPGPEMPAYSLDGAPVDPMFDGDNPYVEDLSGQDVYCQHVYWRDFRLAPARCWGEVRWIAFRHVMTRDELIDQFGEKGRLVPLNHTVAPEKKDNEETADVFKRAVVWEIWDKVGKKQIFIADGHDDILDEVEDPLNLEGFFPMPAPLYGVTTTDNMVPIPEYTVYQDQAMELDKVTGRIDKLIDALKVRGIYAGTLKEVEKLISDTDGENKMIAVMDWEEIRSMGGLEKAMAFMPLEAIAQVLIGLYNERRELKAEIYEITGLSDIIRGSTDSRETASAQRIKGNFGSMRMTPRQKPMQRFIRDLLRLKAELMAEHYQAETFARITGMQVPEEVMALLKDDKTRGFRIDIETDSTIEPDREAEKQNAVEFVTAITGYLQAAGEIAMQAPYATPLLMEMLKFSARRFKAGRGLEDIIDQTAQQAIQAAQQPRPDPEAEKRKAEVEVIKQKAQVGAQQAQANIEATVKKVLAQIQADSMKAQADIRNEDIKTQAQIERDDIKAANDMEIAQQKARESAE